MPFSRSLTEDCNLIRLELLLALCLTAGTLNFEEAGENKEYAVADRNQVQGFRKKSVEREGDSVIYVKRERDVVCLGYGIE